jgi:hypothetical protein
LVIDTLIARYLNPDMKINKLKIAGSIPVETIFSLILILPVAL